MTDKTGDLGLSEKIAEEIHRRIVTGEIPLGSKLRQDAVAAEFDVSRTPVREAFRALHGQGVIQITPRRGALVNGSTPRDIRENQEVRAELEGLAAELATERIDDSQLRRLREAVAEFESIAERAEQTEDRRVITRDWVAVNDRFHSTLVQSADNQHLVDSIQELRRRIPQNTAAAALSGNARLLVENAADHASILEAVEAQDPGKARMLARSHVSRSVEMVARRFEREYSRAT